MKLVNASSLFKTLASSLVLITMTGQQVAFAASGVGAPIPSLVRSGTPSVAVVAPQSKISIPLSDVHALLPVAKTGKQGIAVIQIAESRPLSVYFQNGGTAAELDRLDNDITNLATANALVGIADDLNVFMPWWESHKTSILFSRSKFQSANLQGFFTEVFIMFKAEETQAQKDPNRFVQWLSDRVTNPTIRYVSYSGFTATAVFFAWTAGIFKGAMVAGPAAGSIGALVEPIVRPIREKASIVGSRLFGKMGLRLSERLFRDRGNTEGAMNDLTNLSADIMKAREGTREAQELMSTMGHEMTSAQYSANMTKLHAIWNKTNLVWVQTNPPLYRDGRDVFSNAIAIRPQGYSGQIMQSLQGAEQARQAIEQHIDRIISRTGKNAQVVEETVVTLLRAVEMNEIAKDGDKDSNAANERLLQAKESLKNLGATDYQVGRIIESRLAELVNVRHTAYTLATNVIHELQYEEYNRALPDDVKTIQRGLRDGTCLDYFHHEYRAQVSKILNGLEIQLDLAQKTVDDAKTSTKLRIVKSKEEAAKSEKAAPSTVTATTVREKLKRATGALSRLNGLPSNRAAIEQTGTLRGENKDSPEARAKEAVKVAGKK